MHKPARSRAGEGGSGRRGCPFFPFFFFFGHNRQQQAEDEIVTQLSSTTRRFCSISTIRPFPELPAVTLMQDGCSKNLGRGRKLSPGQAQAQQTRSLAFHLLNNALCGIQRNLGMAENSSSSKPGIHLLLAQELQWGQAPGAAAPCATQGSSRAV